MPRCAHTHRKCQTKGIKIQSKYATLGEKRTVESRVGLGTVQKNGGLWGLQNPDFYRPSCLTHQVVVHVVCVSSPTFGSLPIELKVGELAAQLAKAI